MDPKVKFTVSDKVVCIRPLPCTAAAAFSSVPEVGHIYCVRGIDLYENPRWGFGPSEHTQFIFLTGIEGRQRPVAGGEFSFPSDFFKLV
jgi:hypothetical protein